MKAWGLITSSSRRRARSGAESTTAAGGREHLRGALPGQLVEDQQLACVSLIRGFQGCAAGRDVPQLQILMAGAQSPGERVLRRVVEEQQPWPPREPQTAGLTQADRVAQGTGRAHPGGFQRDDARNRQQVTRVRFQLEAFEPARQQQDCQRIVSVGRRSHGSSSGASAVPPVRAVTWDSPVPDVGACSPPGHQLDRR